MNLRLKQGAKILGLMLGLMMITPAFSASQPAASGNGLGVNYDQLMTALDPFNPELKPAPTTPDGRTRMLGKTQGGSTGLLEVSGKSLSSTVEKATLSLVVTKDNGSNRLNGVLLEQYLRAIFPEWDDRFKWAAKAIKGGQKVTIDRPGKRITFTQISQLQMFIFTVEAI